MNSLHTSSLSPCARAWRKAVLHAAVGSVTILGAHQIAHAADASWNATPANGNWNAANWTSGANTAYVPLPGDALSFDASSVTSLNNNFAANTTFTGLTFLPGAGTYTITGNGMKLGVRNTGSITSSGDIINNSPNDQNVGLPITLDTGKHFITTGTGALNLTGAITQNKGSYAVFTTGGGALNVNGSGLVNTNGILGGWAVIGGDWASLDGSNHVVAYTGYVNVDAAAGSLIVDGASTNVRITANGGPINMTPNAAGGTITSVNTILYGGGSAALGAAQAINVGVGSMLVLGQNGGIFNTSSSGGTVRSLNIGTNAANGGILTAGDGINPANITISSTATTDAHRTAGVVTVNSIITDNPTVNAGAPAPVSLTIAGGYVTATQANTYTGGTYILSGRLSQATQASVGTGPIYIFAGGQMNSNSSFTTNPMFISGDGTPEQAGMGALRLFGTASIATTITLTDNASIVATNNSTPTITGKITGPGGLRIGHGNGSQGGGTLTTNPGAPNDYAGDTIITGPTGGTNNQPISYLKFGSSNVMPHGLTGSFNGGPTGNVILDAAVPSAGTNHSSTFDLNGTTQTINGLSSTATAPANNFIDSTAGGGVLILGDANANGNYAGIIQGGSNLSITKIGSGSQTFSGNNTYSGVTTIKAGKLILANNAKNPVLSGTGGADVQGGRLVLDYNDTGTAPDVKSILAAGFAQSPKFSAGQIRTTNPAASDKGLGWKDDSTAKQVTVAYTWYGDANLDGQVDVTDLGALATNWQTSNVWSGGDFNYDGFVDVTDLGALATNWQKGVGNPLARQSLQDAMAAVGLGGTAVPEPATIGLIAVGAWSLKRPRRRK